MYLWCFSLCASSVARAEVILSALFSDHAVLQRNQPIRVWGWASPGETVQVEFHGKNESAIADKDGEWQVWLKPESAGGPYDLTVSGDKTQAAIKRTDLLIGDVWIASGQSNMEFPLTGWTNQPMKNGPAEIAAANHSRLRLLKQEKIMSNYPLPDISGKWVVCTPETVAGFSAVAYLFGKDLLKRENVPIGLIETAWGGTPAHSWISPMGLGEANLESVYRDAGQIALDVAHAHAQQALYAREDQEARAMGRPVPKHPGIPSEALGPFLPGVLFNAMIAPYTRYSIKGVIWYQGETDRDAPRAPYYDRVFPTLIRDWRKQWAEGDFPFLFVQISSFEAKTGDWGAVRDAQRKTLSLRNTAMAVTLDIGSKKVIHPPDKETVSARLVAAARGIAYGEDLKWQSPTFERATIEGSTVRVWLSHAEGLTAKDNALSDFELAGSDLVYHPAEAKIEKYGDAETIIVSSRDVIAPLYVRYGWAPYVTCYIYNGSGLPLGTFSSQ